MAVINGETTNLQAALTYTLNMAAGCRDGMASLETSIAALQAGEVGGMVVANLQQAQEAFNIAGGALMAANAALQHHLQVKEAYTANPDAGNKQFVVQD